MKIAVIGVTGLVGRVILRVLEESKLFSNVTILAVASERSAGKKLTFRGEEHEVCGLRDALLAEPDIAIFSAGADISREWAPEFADKQTYVIDNSSAWRQEAHIPLVVPEINSFTIEKNTPIIANPNCSTIQMVLALAPRIASMALRGSWFQLISQ